MSTPIRPDPDTVCTELLEIYAQLSEVDRKVSESGARDMHAELIKSLPKAEMLDLVQQIGRGIDALNANPAYKPTQQFIDATMDTYELLRDFMLGALYKPSSPKHNVAPQRAFDIFFGSNLDIQESYLQTPETADEKITDDLYRDFHELEGKLEDFYDNNEITERPFKSISVRYSPKDTFDDEDEYYEEDDEDTYTSEDLDSLIGTLDNKTMLFRPIDRSDFSDVNAPKTQSEHAEAAFKANIEVLQQKLTDALAPREISANEKQEFREYCKIEFEKDPDVTYSIAKGLLIYEQNTDDLPGQLEKFLNKLVTNFIKDKLKLDSHTAPSID